MEKNKTAVEWLAEKYNHLAMLRSREEIPASLSVELLENFFEESKKMEKQQIMDAHISAGARLEDISIEAAEQYYTETYGKQQNG
jgi:hypothetical protein